MSDLKSLSPFHLETYSIFQSTPRIKSRFSPLSSWLSSPSSIYYHHHRYHYHLRLFQNRYHHSLVGKRYLSTICMRQFHISYNSLLFFRAPMNENNQPKVAVPYSVRFLPRSYFSVFPDSRRWGRSYTVKLKLAIVAFRDTHATRNQQMQCLSK